MSDNTTEAYTRACIRVAIIVYIARYSLEVVSIVKVFIFF